MNTIIQLLPLAINIVIVVLIIRFIISYVRKSWGIDILRQQNDEMLKKVDEMQLKIDEIRERLNDK